MHKSGLSAGASLGVTTEDTPTESSPVTFATGASAGDDAYFFSASTGSVTQTATATLSNISYKFFKATIHAYLPDNGEEP